MCLQGARARESVFFRVDLWRSALQSAMLRQRREYTQINVSRWRQRAQIKRISREPSPGHTDGNDVFCH